MSNSHSTSPAAPPRPSAGLWPYLWVLVIGIALIPNGIMLFLAKSQKPATVEAHAYEASARFDQEKAARAAFMQAGLVLQVQPLGQQRLRLSLEGADQAQELQVQFRRANDAALDRSATWADPREGIELTLPAAGAWDLILDGKLGSQTVQAQRQIDVP